MKRPEVIYELPAEACQGIERNIVLFRNIHSIITFKVFFIPENCDK